MYVWSPAAARRCLRAKGAERPCAEQVSRFVQSVSTLWLAASRKLELHAWLRAHSIAGNARRRPCLPREAALAAAAAPAPPPCSDRCRRPPAGQLCPY